MRRTLLLLAASIALDTVPPILLMGTGRALTGLGHGIKLIGDGVIRAGEQTYLTGQAQAFKGRKYFTPSQELAPVISTSSTAPAAI